MILRILLFLTLLLLIPPFAIDRLALRRLGKPWWRAVVYIPSVVLLAALCFAAWNESYTAQADRLKGTLLTWALVVAVPEAFLALWLALARLFAISASFRRKLYKGFSRVGYVASALLFAAMVYGGFMGFRRLVVVPTTIRPAALPCAFSGYRIVQLSDLHLGTFSGRGEVVRAIVDSVNRLRPDLIVVTGDLVNYRASEAAAFLSEMKRLRARDGVVSVMGNHDYAQYYRHLSSADSVADILALQRIERAAGWHLLLNDRLTLRRGNDSLVIAGVENGGRPPFPNQADLPRALRGLSPEAFVVLLSHDPTLWRRAVVGKTRVALTLSGHTHGMQFRVGHFSPAAWFYPEWGGLYSAGRQQLFVSQGVGQVLLPFRLGAWPEINLITLR